VTNHKRAHLLLLAVPAALMAGAFGSQFLGGLVPCELCQWQRYAHYTAIASAILAFVVPHNDSRHAFLTLALSALFMSGALGIYHAGVEYKWWLGPEHCSPLPGKGGDLLNNILTAPLIRCDEAQWSLFGISLAGYNAIISLAASAFILNAFRKPA
jgi:disulfide bond formation protein DsbB